MIVMIPTRKLVENLKIGDLAVDCFGNLNQVVEIYYRGTDVEGRAYVGFYTQWGTSARISGSYKEGELVRTLPLTSQYSSHELTLFEQKTKLERQIKQCG